MSDALHSSTANIEALVDEIVAGRPGRIRWRPSNYAGLKASYRRQKYTGCERVNVDGQNIRKLTPRELTEFRTEVQRAINGESRAEALKLGCTWEAGARHIPATPQSAPCAADLCTPTAPCWQPNCERCMPA